MPSGYYWNILASNGFTIFIIIYSLASHLYKILPVLFCCLFIKVPSSGINQPSFFTELGILQHLYCNHLASYSFWYFLFAGASCISMKIIFSTIILKARSHKPFPYLWLQRWVAQPFWSWSKFVCCLCEFIYYRFPCYTLQYTTMWQNNSSLVNLTEDDCLWVVNASPC